MTSALRAYLIISLLVTGTTLELEASSLAAKKTTKAPAAKAAPAPADAATPAASGTNPGTATAATSGSAAPVAASATSGDSAATAKPSDGAKPAAAPDAKADAKTDAKTDTKADAAGDKKESGKPEEKGDDDKKSDEKKDDDKGDKKSDDKKDDDKKSDDKKDDADKKDDKCDCKDGDKKDKKEGDEGDEEEEEEGEGKDGKKEGADQAAVNGPQFEFGKQKKVEGVEWQGTAQLGLLLTTGNANSLSFSGAGTVSRNDGKNLISLDVAGAYGQASLLTPNDLNGNGMIDGPDEELRTSRTVTQFWQVKLRYDRFFNERNIAYLSAQALGDTPAGKPVTASAQAGYSRQLYKSARNLLNAEAGYDFTFEKYDAETGGIDHLLIHSLRIFVAYKLTLSKAVVFNSSIEGLFNLNPYTAPGVAEDLKPFEDTRINFKASLTTKLWKALSFRFTFNARYDHVPAPRPALLGPSPTGDLAAVPYGANYTPLAEPLDTLSEASLVFTYP